MSWLALGLAGCEQSGPAGTSAGQAVVARFDGGVVMREEVLREVERLPPHLRKQFETEAGEREFTRSMVDKRLLALEAARRGFTQEPEIRRQVRELEERLSIKALLAHEERTTPPPAEAEAREFYEANRERFVEPERLRVARVLAAVPAGSPRAQWSQARQRAEGFRRRLLAGEPVARVAEGGDGPERARGGEFGLLARGEFGSATLEAAALSLSKAGAVSQVVEEPGGAAVVVLLERRPARVPPFEEVRTAVLGRMAPLVQRRVLEKVLTRLRAEAGVQLERPSGAVDDAQAVIQH